MNIYVNPASGGDGSSRARPFQYLQSAVNAARPGDVILLAAGTYSETVTVTTSGTAAARITIKLDNDFGGSGGLAILDGTGHPRTIAFLGASYWDLYDVRIKNNTGDHSSFTYGLVITSSTENTVGLGSHHIRFVNGSVTGVNRRVEANKYAVPIAIYSSADTGAGGTVTHHVEISGVAVYDCDTSDYPATTAFEIPLVLVSGSVEHWTLTRCKLAVITRNSSAVEIGGDLNSVPPNPLKGVMSFNDLTTSTNTANGLYCQGNRQTLIMGNRVTGFNVAYEVNTEGASPDTLAGLTWVLGNEAVECNTGVVAGPWADTYSTVEDVYIIRNKFTLTGNPTGGGQLVVLQGKRTGQPGLAGDCLFAGNIVKAGADLLYYNVPATATVRLERNLYATNDPTPFTIADVASGYPYATYQDRYASVVALTADLTAAADDLGACPQPTWWYSGIFGYYEPTTYTSWSGTNLITPSPVDAGA